MLRPQIISNVSVNTSLIAPAGDRIAAMIGTAQWGPVDEVTYLSTLDEFVSVFKDDITGSTLTGIKGADLFFRNGGTLKFVRVEDGTADFADYTAVNGVTDVIVFTAKYKGTFGNNILLLIEAVDTTKRKVTITDGTNIEIFDNNGSGYTTNSSIATAINAGSNLVTAAVESGQESANLVDTISSYAQLTGGANGTTSVAVANYTSILDDQLLLEEYNFLLIPGETTDANQNTIVGKLNTRATQEKLYSRYITGTVLNETIATMSARTSSGSRLTIVAPGVVYTNRYDAATLNLDGSYLACAYAGMLCGQDLEISGTHKTVNVEGIIIDTTTNKQYYSKVEQEQILGNRIAPISLINNTIQMVRGVTRNSTTTSIFFEEYIVDIIDEVTKTIEDYLNSILGNPKTNLDILAYTSRVNAILESLRTQQIIESYQDTVITSGSSPDTLLVSVNIKPTYNTNFVLLTLNINS